MTDMTLKLIAQLPKEVNGGWGTGEEKNDSTFYFDLAPIYKIFLALNILVSKAGEIFSS